MFITPLPTAGNASISANQAPTSSSGPTWGEDFSDTLYFESGVPYANVVFDNVRAVRAFYTGPISLCLDSFFMYVRILCISVYCI